MAYRNMVFDFTKCYQRQKTNDLAWFDCSGIGGSRLYCSKEAEEKIKDLIRPNGVSGIHFIDSGDYHYITKFMTDFIKEPFILILIDHHTDMQDSGIGDLLSCGNWAKKVLSENPYVQKLVLIGQEQKTLDQPAAFCSDKLIEISYEELKNLTAQDKIQPLPKHVPVYISIDKDVLSDSYAITNWDQGEMSLRMLEDVLKVLVTNYDIIGIDICGDFPEENNIPKFLHAERVNQQSDEELYRFLQHHLRYRPSNNITPIV